jgi:dTDP-4-amino-4,6-dideoxygalactose transaminase
VHYTGNVANMPAIAAIARRHGLVIVEDGCQSLLGAIDGMPVGSWGDAVAFSLHPLKNLNVWSDGGLVVTRSADVAERLRLMRNHGLVNRDGVAVFGINSRLDTIQAAIGNLLIDDTPPRTARRVAIAARYDEAFTALLPAVRVPRRRPGVYHVYHLYMLRVANRDRMLAWLNERGIEAKVHYPVPVHMQPAAASLGYKAGDFPVCEQDCRDILTLPAHPYLSDSEIDYTIEQVRLFMAER